MSNEINKSLTGLFDQVLNLPHSSITPLENHLSFLSIPLKCCYYKNKISNSINNENQYLDYKKVLIPYFENKKKKKKLGNISIYFIFIIIIIIIIVIIILIFYIYLLLIYIIAFYFDIIIK